MAGYCQHRWQPATLATLPAACYARRCAQPSMGRARDRSSEAEQGPFKPRVVGSNPTGLTQPEFADSDEQAASQLFTSRYVQEL